MNNLRIRSILKEEIARKAALANFGEEFEYIMTEASLNELDISSSLGSILSFAEDNLGQASTDAVKQFVIKTIFQYLTDMGLPLTPNSIFGSVLINVIQNLTASDMASYFSEDGCEKVADRIIMGLQEGFQEEVILNKIAFIFFGEGARLEGLIGSPIRELINIKLKDMTEALREPIVKFACDHRDMEKLLKDLKQSTGIESSSSDRPAGSSMVRLRR
jgi:hypothetical protein